MKYRLINIGRSKFNGIVDVKTDDDLLRAVGKHPMSRDIEIDEGGSVWAGMRIVGRIENVNEDAEATS